MLLFINNSENNLKNTTWNLKAYYVIKKLLKDKTILVNTTNEMNEIIADKDQRKNIKGIILTGSELRIKNKLCLKKIMDNILPLLELNVPVLGLCFGLQVLGSIYQSKFSSFNTCIKGHVEVKLDTRYKIFKNMNLHPSKKDKLPRYSTMFVEHNDWLKTKPILFNIIAESNGIIYGIKHEFKQIYGLQFHPEFSYISDGIQIYKNFLKICGLKYNTNLNYSDVQEVKH